MCGHYTQHLKRHSTMRTWYNLKASDTKATISIFDAIGEYGVSAKNFLNDLRGVKASEVDVEINSPGGDVFAGIAIYNGLRQSGKKINVKIMGVAASAASLIAMAGDTIDMPANTFLMVHNPWSFAMGSAEDMRDTADMLDKIGSSLVATYAKRTGKSDEEITALLNAETWMTAQEAVDAGFATSVSDAIAAKAEYDIDRVPAHVKAVLNTAADDAPATDTPADDVNDADADADSAAPEITFADQVQAMAEGSGFAAYAGAWALDPNTQSVDAVKARITECREIQSLCKLVGKTEASDSLIRAGKTLAQARASLQEQLAGGQEIDTTPRNSKPTPPAQPTALRFSEAWAKRV